MEKTTKLRSAKGKVVIDLTKQNPQNFFEGLPENPIDLEIKCDGTAGGHGMIWSKDLEDYLASIKNSLVSFKISGKVTQQNIKKLGALFEENKKKLIKVEFTNVLNELGHESEEILRELNTALLSVSGNIRGFSFTGGSLGFDGVKALQGFFEESKRLMSLNLAGCKIGAGGIRILAQYLEEGTKSLIEINFSGGKLKEATHDLSSLLLRQKSLRHLTLSGNKLESVTALGLARLGNLESVDLSHNNLSESFFSGTKADLTTFLTLIGSTNPELTELNLVDNDLSRHVAKIGEALRGNNTLRVLNLGDVSESKTADEDISKLSEILPEVVIVVSDKQHKQLKKESVAAVREAQAMPLGGQSNIVSL